MVIKKFCPMVDKEKRRVDDLYYVYLSGRDLVLNFGNIYGRKITPDVMYLMISRDERFHPDTTDIFSDKTAHNSRYNIPPEDWGNVYHSVFNRGKLCDINGNIGIVAFPYSAYLTLFFDIKREELLMIPYWRLHNTPEFKAVFNKIREYYGDISAYYDFRTKLTMLTTEPCGEVIPNIECGYMFTTGVQLRNEFRDLGFGNKGVPEGEVCLLVYIKDTHYAKPQIRKNKSPLLTPGEDVKLVRNPWITCELKDDSDYPKLSEVLYDTRYTNSMCMINGFHCVISYPMNSWNPIIWCTDTNDVIVLPSKMYTEEDEYWCSITSVLGELKYT